MNVECSQTLYFLFTEVIKNSYIWLRIVNWIHWRASSTTNISTREIRCESFCAFSITSAFFIFNPGYNLPYIFFITPHGMLVLLLFLACWCKLAWRYGEINKWLSSIWSVVRAPNWYLGYNGFQCLPWPSLTTALNDKEVPFFKEQSFIYLGVDHWLFRGRGDMGDFLGGKNFFRKPLETDNGERFFSSTS